MSIRRSNKYLKAITEMRNNGFSFKEIGEELGVTRQYANYVYNQKDISEKQREIFDRIIYPNIKEWMIENDMTASQFNFMIGEHGDFINSSFGRFVRGETKGNIRLIRKVLDVTGMTFEEAFYLESEKECG